MQDSHNPYAPFRSPDYRRFMAANFLAIVGAQVQSVAVGYQLYQRTDSSMALGLVGLIQFLPILLFTLPAGQAADRYSRTAVLMAAQSLMAGASLGLAALSYWEGPVVLTYLCLLLSGVGQAFRFPARQALVPQVVPQAVLATAITWNSSAWQVASVLGPALGGLVIAEAAGKTTLAYAGAAVCSLACVALLFGIRPRAGNQQRLPPTLASLLAGVTFVRRNRLILATITLDLFAVLFGGATALMPVFARDILHVGAVGLGWLYAAPSAGALVMAVVLAHRPPLRRAGRALLWAVALFGVATVVFGVSRDYLLSFTMLVLTGALDNVSVVVRGTLIQLLTPELMRGRVSAVNALFINSSNQLGAFESGLTAQWFGPVLSVVGGGVGTLLVVAGVMAMWPELLRLGPLDQVTAPDHHSASQISAAPTENKSAD